MQIEGKLPISTFITFWSFFWSMSDNPPSLIVFDSVKNLQLISCFFCAPSWLGVFLCLHFRGGLWRLNYYNRECGVRTLLTAKKRHHNMQQLISVCTLTCNSASCITFQHSIGLICRFQRHPIEMHWYRIGTGMRYCVRGSNFTR